MKYTAIYLFTALVSLSLLTSCKKDTEIENANQVGSSKVIYFPSVTLNGDAILMVQPGTTFTDPGVTALLNGATITYTTTGTVGTAPGIYVLNYTAANPQGYTASVFRAVVILDNSVLSNDFSGTYTRSSNGLTSTWTKIGPGEYTVENPGGAAGVTGTVTAVNYTGFDVAIPLQNSAIGLTSSTDESPIVTGGVFTGYNWEIVNAGYGTSLRTFTK